jgi:O-antigen/teichoic acid export membrane protein
LATTPSEAVETVHAPSGLFQGETVGRALGVYVPTIGVSRAIGLARSIIQTWLISRGEYGLLAVSLLVINVLTPVGSWGLYEGLARYVPAFETRNALLAFLRRAMPLALGVATGMAVLLLLTAKPVGVALFSTLQLDSPGPDAMTTHVAAITRLTRWAALAVFAVSGYHFVLSVLKGLRMFRAVSLFELAAGVMFTALAIGVVLAGAKTAQAVVVGYAVTAFVIAALFAAVLWRRLRRWDAQRGPLEPGERVVRRLLGFSVWAALAAVMWQTLQNYPIWYLNKIHGYEASAVFGGIRTLTQIVLILTAAAVTVVMTLVTKAWESQGRDVADRQLLVAFKVTMLALLVACTPIVIWRAQVVRIFPATFADGATIVPVLLLFFLIGSELTFLAIHFRLIEKTRLMFWPWSLGVVTNVTLAAFWVRRGADDTTLPMTGQLRPSAWVAVAAMAVALAVCLLLLLAERRPIDRGSWVVLAAGFALVLPWPALIGVVLILVVFARPVLFSREEAAMLRRHASEGVARFRRRPPPRAGRHDR